MATVVKVELTNLESIVEVLVTVSERAFSPGTQSVFVCFLFFEDVEYPEMDWSTHRYNFLFYIL